MFKNYIILIYFLNITFLALCDEYKGQKHFKEGRYEEAAKEFLDAEIEHPDVLKHAYNRALSQYMQQKWQDSISGFAKSAQSKDPELSYQSHFNWGNALIKSGKLQEAMDVYKKAKEINAQDPNLDANMSWLQKRIEELKQQQQKQDNKSDKNDKNDQSSKNQQSDQNNDSKQNQQNQENQDQHKDNSQQENQNGSDEQEQRQDQDQNQSEQSQSGEQNQGSEKEGQEKQSQAQKDSDREKEEQSAQDGKEDENKKDEKVEKDDFSLSKEGQKEKMKNQGQQKMQQMKATMTKEAALRLLQSLEDNEQAYGRKPKVNGRYRKPEKDW